MDEQAIDQLIRDITRPEGGDLAASKSAARSRLLAVATAQRCRPPSARLKFGRRGIAVIALLLVLPAGAAVATELTRERAQLVDAADCPELFAEIEKRDLDAEGVQLASCPAAEGEIDRYLLILDNLAEQRALLEGKGASRPSHSDEP